MRLIEREIEELKNELRSMARLVSEQMNYCSQAIITNNPELIKKIKKKERKINKYDIEIDKKCERIVALFQPVAVDLRFLFASIKINLYLEQIGDNFNSISTYLSQLNAPISEEWLEKLYLKEMISRVKEIYEIATNAFFNADAEQAKLVFLKDDSVDRIHRYTQRKFATFVKEFEETGRDITEFMFILAVIKHLEKVADHCTNIAEDTLYYIEGVYYKHSPLKRKAVE